jgi:uncharacterized protein YlxW (UPF0749 family)
VRGRGCLACSLRGASLGEISLEQQVIAMKGFKSPAYKLIAFFEKSRDSWKMKYMEARYSVKKLQRRLRYLTARKKELRERVKALEKELSRVRAEKGTEEPEKKRPASSFLP